jgi:heme A synthase
VRLRVSYIAFRHHQTEGCLADRHTMILSRMSKNFTRFAWMVLAFTVSVVLWGAYVRATEAGAGCGNHWPLCNGEVLPRSPAATTVIEFTHRAMSGIDGILIAGLFLWAFRIFPRHHLARLGAALSFGFLIAEALIGAALVKLGQVAQNVSLSRAWWEAGHLINTLILLACLTLTAWWASGGQERTEKAAPRGRGAGIPAWPAIVLFVLTGISGAIAALGDTLFPAASLASGFQRDFDPAANVLLRLRLFHPFLAVTTAAWLLFYAAHTAIRLPKAKAYARTLLALASMQVAAGALNLLLLAPVWMQIVHLLLADLVWIALVLVIANSNARGAAGTEAKGDPELSFTRTSARVSDACLPRASETTR